MKYNLSEENNKNMIATPKNKIVTEIEKEIKTKNNIPKKNVEKQKTIANKNLFINKSFIVSN